MSSLQSEVSASVSPTKLDVPVVEKVKSEGSDIGEAECDSERSAGSVSGSPLSSDDEGEAGSVSSCESRRGGIRAMFADEAGGSEDEDGEDDEDDEDDEDGFKCTEGDSSQLEARVGETLQEYEDRLAEQYDDEMDTIGNNGAPSILRTVAVQNGLLLIQVAHPTEIISVFT